MHLIVDSLLPCWNINLSQFVYRLAFKQRWCLFARCMQFHKNFLMKIIHVGRHSLSSILFSHESSKRAMLRHFFYVFPSIKSHLVYKTRLSCLCTISFFHIYFFYNCNKIEKRTKKSILIFLNDSIYLTPSTAWLIEIVSFGGS